MTLKSVMALTLRYFNQFAKSAFQLITGSKAAAVTHIAQERDYQLFHLVIW